MRSRDPSPVVSSVSQILLTCVGALFRSPTGPGGAPFGPAGFVNCPS
jgi:hypothetical protein